MTDADDADGDDVPVFDDRKDFLKAVLALAVYGVPPADQSLGDDRDD